MTPIQELTTSFTAFGLYLTLFYNLVLIYLTLFYIKQIVRTYKFMIVTFALLGIVFAFWEHITKPYIHNFNSSLIYFSTNDPEFYSFDFLKYALAIYGGLYSALMSFTAVQFIFRHLTLKNSGILSKSHCGLAVMTFGYVLLFGTLFFGFIKFLWEPNSYSDDYLRKELQSVYNFEVTKIPRFVVLPYGPLRESNKKDQTSLLGCLCVISFQYLVTLYCAIKMNKNIQKNLKNSSKQHCKLERQFFKALMVQITLPTILLTLPALPVLLCPFLNIQISLQSGFIYTLFSFYTPLDSMLFMYIVDEYKDRLREIFIHFSNDMRRADSYDLNEIALHVI